MFRLVSYRDPMIEPESDVPVYVQLADILREKIRSGEYPSRRAIPSIRTLQQTYGVADGTIQKALKILKDEGLVRTVRGRGIFVTSLPESLS